MFIFSHLWGQVEIWPLDFQDLIIRDLRQPRFIDNCSKYPSPWPKKNSNSKVTSNFKSIIGLGVLFGFFLGFVGQVVISRFHVRVGQFHLWRESFVGNIVRILWINHWEHCNDVHQWRGTWVGNILWKRLSDYRLSYRVHSVPIWNGPQP